MNRKLSTFAPLYPTIAVMLTSASLLFSAPLTLKGINARPEVTPSWVVSGAWSRSSEELILVDALKSRMLRYSNEGDFLGQVQGLAKVVPSLISSYSDGFLLEEEDGHLIWLDKRLKTVKRGSLLASEPEGDYALASVFSWAPASDGYAYAFGDIRKGTGEAIGDWSSAFVRVSLSNPKKLEILHKVSTEDTARNFYLLGMPFVAAVGSKGYFMVMAAEPYILESVPKPGGSLVRKLEVPVGELGRRPTLPEKRGITTAAALFSALEKAAMPAGLYGTEEGLFVLLRRPGKGNQTEWSLAKVNTPNTGTVTLTVRIIESSANHMTVVPGPHRWALLEKGPVVSLGQQDVLSILLLEANDLQ